MNQTDTILDTLRQAGGTMLSAADLVARFPEGSPHRLPGNGTTAESRVRANCNVMVRRRLLTRVGTGRTARFGLAEGSAKTDTGDRPAQRPRTAPTIKRTVPPDEQLRRAADARRQMHMRQAIEGALQAHLGQFTETIIRDALQRYTRALSNLTESP